MVTFPDYRSPYQVPYAAGDPNEAAIWDWIVMKNGTGQNAMPYSNESVSTRIS